MGPNVVVRSGGVGVVVGTRVEVGSGVLWGVFHGHVVHSPVSRMET